MSHILAILVENQSGVLTRVAGLFSRRGYNIDSLAVGQTHDPGVSRMTIVVDGDSRVIDQVVKQLDKLVDVIEVSDISGDEHLDRELVLIKVEAEPEVRGEIMQIVDIFRARIVDIGHHSLIIECTGDAGKIRAIENSLKPFGILELVRTGKIAMVRGQKYGEG
ncbi:MAG: acetolactate synthase small subunit [Syntrophaceticus sp.]|jgi:acetolactate synthase-1/3 small subunit|nr:acetolactate synthase small subunit [Syntrophaceticus sp.]MDD4782623.1 acetolactate synthase small subunit [Syntrophaceticus sp.]HBG22202.1 acetolactate synthase small subunit [Peptococcaceae bacterium]HBI27938.1 acetolactate synthase small subunit [Peptococcaceae bacterium]